MVKILDISDPPNLNKVQELNAHLDNDMVFYVVYRPGCPACDGFMPNWNIFTEQMKNVSMSGVVLAKINENSLDNVNIKGKEYIQGVPHIMLQNKETTIEYDGNREPDNLSAFLKQHTTSGQTGGSKRKIKKRMKHSTKKKMRKHKKSMKRKKRKTHSRK